MQMRRQCGSLLVENMVALVIFSIGVIGMIGMLSLALKQSSEAKYRNDAGYLANQILAKMWVDDKSNAALTANYASPNGTKFLAWQSEVQGKLPGASTNAPSVSIDAQNLVTVTVQWKAPGKATASHHSVSASINP